VTSADGTVEVERSEPSATERKEMGGALPRLDVGHAAGRYLVLGTLGTGAMGTVYRAYDPQLQREVALKRLRPGAADDRAAARLLREARAMARLSHPNVVAVYDVVAEDDGVTLAMECVEGGTLSDWLEEARDCAAVLAVMRDAGRGLAAAHRAGLVHRDFKPGNVLIASDGAVKVTDFGLVKARGDLGPGSAEAGDDEVLGAPDGDLTGHGTVVGTPRYMAPEQARGGVADARSDQYSFCVSLWRALAGKAPFQGGDEALQAAKHRGPPALPRAVRVSTRVARAIERGLAVDPADRWPGMDALLRELTPPRSSGLRWAAAGTVAAAAASVAIVAWAGGNRRPCEDVGAALDTAWSDASRAEIHAAFEGSRAVYAATAWRRIESDLDAYAQQWRAQRADACAAVHLRREQTTAEMDLRVGCLEEARRRFAAAVDVLHDADAAVVAHAFELVRDLPPLTRCGDVDALARDGREAPRGVSASLVEELEAAGSRARALFTAGRYAEAQTVAAAAWERSVPLDPHPLRARIGSSYAQALGELGKLDDAEAVFREALRNAVSSSADAEAATVARLFAHYLTQDQERTSEALTLAELSASIAARPDARPGLAAGAASVLGQVYRGLGRWDEALEYDRRALELRTTRLGSDHPDVAVSRNNLGLLLYDLDRAHEAIEHLEEAVRIWRDHLGDEHPEVALARNNLAMALERAGRLTDAEDSYREALRVRTAALGETHPVTIASQHNLGLVKMSQGRHEEAEALIRGAVEAWDEVLAPRHPHRALGHNSLGLVLRELGREAEAEAAFVTAVELGEAAFGEDHPQMCQLWNNLARQRIDRGENDSARELTTRSLALCADRLGPEHRATKTARELLGQLTNSGP
jgi:tetratricopeptide (TPR) repeat protein/tRNA A-37 threonylcarbamoyl transferase component Bud32